MSIKLMMSFGPQWETKKMQFGYGYRSNHGPATLSSPTDQTTNLTVPWANIIKIIWSQFTIIIMVETNGLLSIMTEQFHQLTHQRWSGV